MKNDYQWKSLDDNPDPPWLVVLAGVLLAAVAILAMFV